MKLAVLGAGVAGITTAFELVEDGHEVTVFERRQTSAEGASFATGGLLAPEWAAAQAELEWQQTSAPGRRRPWWSILRTGRPSTRSNPGPLLLEMARYSMARLSDLSERLMLSTEHQQGLMALWKNPSDQPVADKLQGLLKTSGCECHAATPEQARGLEAALNRDASLAGALVVPEAWSANCRQFTLQLKAHALQSGCRFEFGVDVLGIQDDPGRQGVWLVSDRKDATTERFDAVVLCTGSATPALLRTFGAHLPMDTWVAHALSGPTREPLDAPLATVHDIQRGITMARAGLRVRVSGPAMPVSRQPRADAAFKPLYAALNEWFPGALRVGVAGGVQEWSGQIARTPDALPLLGPSGWPGIWLNTAHGMNGWLLACGCARAIADQLAGNTPAQDLTPFLPQRFRD